MTEQGIQSNIMKLLKSIGAYAIKNIVSNRSGVSDITACLPPDGKYFSCEVKLPGEAPRPLQLHHLQEVQKSGGLSMSATSVDEVKTYLSQHGYFNMNKEI